MKYLYKVFRQYDQSEFEKRYTNRLNMESVVNINLNIKPIKQPHYYELFYVPTNEMIEKVAEIYKVSGQISFIFNQLPSVAKDQFITECLVEELFNTNELEGVHSTKDEIARSVRNVHLNIKDNQRFNSMIRSYMNLFNGEKIATSNIADIRNIYDKITENEIAEKELPDGDLFRKDVTHVLKKSGSGKVIHKGLTPEVNIKVAMEKLLNLMNHKGEIPTIIKIAISHYYFGYIHPFYDGNGRTSRFISSVYLSNALGLIPSLSLSRGCNKMRNNYLVAFEYTNSIMNRGEMNFFIDTFLDILLTTLLEMNAELKEKYELLKTAHEKIKNDPDIVGEKHSNFMFILAQDNLFHHNEGLTIKELAHEMKLSKATTRKISRGLIEKTFIKQHGVRPAYFSIDDEYMEH